MDIGGPDAAGVTQHRQERGNPPSRPSGQGSDEERLSRTKRKGKRKDKPSREQTKRNAEQRMAAARRTEERAREQEQERAEQQAMDDEEAAMFNAFSASYQTCVDEGRTNLQIERENTNPSLFFLPFILIWRLLVLIFGSKRNSPVQFKDAYFLVNAHHLPGYKGWRFEAAIERGIAYQRAASYAIAIAVRATATIARRDQHRGGAHRSLIHRILRGELAKLGVSDSNMDPLLVHATRLYEARTAHELKARELARYTDGFLGSAEDSN